MSETGEIHYPDELKKEKTPAQESSESNPQHFLDFTHAGKQFSIEERHGGKDEFIVLDANGIPQGKIEGYLDQTEDGETVFSSNGLVSYTRNTPNHTPELIREAIWQLMEQKKVNKWETSDNLSPGAIKLYEGLKENKDKTLEVIASQTEYGPRYSLALKPDEEEISLTKDK